MQTALDGLTQLNRDRRDLQLSLSAEAPCKPLVLAKASNQPSLAFPPYERITRATKDLHLALSSAFMGTPSSATITHARKDIAHQAKLFIDASKTNDEVRSTIMLSCPCNPDDEQVTPAAMNASDASLNIITDGWKPSSACKTVPSFLT